MRIKKQTFLFFLCFTVIGTFLHESGHALAALLNGCKAVIHYSHTNYYCGDKQPTEAESLIMGLAGPFVNMLIGSIGFLLLRRGYKSGHRKNEVLLSVISFFWSREIVVLIADLVLKPLWYPSASFSDEQRTSLVLFHNPFVFPVLFGAVGMLLCGVTVFYFLKQENRLSFILFGLLGSAAGYLFWFHFLGPVLLP